MANKKPDPPKKPGTKPKGTKQGPQLSRPKAKKACPRLSQREHGSSCPLCHGSGEVSS